MTFTLKFAQPNPLRSEYVAISGDLYIQVDRVNPGWPNDLGWQVFIERMSGPTPLESELMTHLYTNYARTRYLAYALASAYAEADALLKLAR